VSSPTISKFILALAAAILLFSGLAPGGHAQKRPGPSAASPVPAVETPVKRSETIGKTQGRKAAPDRDDEDGEDDEEDGEEGEDEYEEDADGDDGDPDGEAGDAAARLQPGEIAGIPPLPARAPIPSLRAPRIAPKPLGPPPPADVWSKTEIAEAKSMCEKLLPGGAFELKALEPIKEGVCGTPAPVALKFFNHAPRVELRPAATVTCGLAEALDRWLKEVVQPRAKALLHANVIRIGSLDAYQCRSRYNDPMQRISHHAFAAALDIAEFMTAKGERIKVLEHWPEEGERGAFLREIHAGACKIFGTVLGPNANAAHKNHFHLDMAKRRFSAYCE
jgi:hypothetical protein